MNTEVKRITTQELIESGYLKDHELETDYSDFSKYIQTIESTCSIMDKCYDIKFYRLAVPPISKGDGFKSHGLSYVSARSRYKQFDEEQIGLETLPLEN